MLDQFIFQEDLFAQVADFTLEGEFLGGEGGYLGERGGVLMLEGCEGGGEGLELGLEGCAGEVRFLEVGSEGGDEVLRDLFGGIV